MTTDCSTTATCFSNTVTFVDLLGTKLLRNMTSGYIDCVVTCTTIINLGREYPLYTFMLIVYKTKPCI